MIPAKQKFETFLKKRKFSTPKIQVIANLIAKPDPNGTAVAVRPSCGGLHGRLNGYFDLDELSLDEHSAV